MLIFARKPVDANANASAQVLRGEDLDALGDSPEDLQEALLALAGPSAGPSGGQIFIDGFSGGQLPSKNSIREIRINQNPFSPGYDKLGFGRIEILTARRTDSFSSRKAEKLANYSMVDPLVQTWFENGKRRSLRPPLTL